MIETCSVKSQRLTPPQEDNSKCSIFSFDINANRSRLPLAKNALRKMKTLRHPGVVKVLDTVEVGGVSGTEAIKNTALIGRQARQTN
jgi:hypothetical protein